MLAHFTTTTRRTFAYFPAHQQRKLIMRSLSPSAGAASASTRALSTRTQKVLAALDLPTDPSTVLPGVFDGEWKGSGEELVSRCPATGEVLARIQGASVEETQAAIKASKAAFLKIRSLPAPKRGDIIRDIRAALDSKVNELGDLVSLEMGKIRSEGKGEVQEFIDICDLATGLSRSLKGNVLPSERPEHVIYEIPNPLGVVGILSAFNFPVAVYGWNLSIALATGNSTIWKPAPSTPLISIALTKLLAPVFAKYDLPGSVAALVCGGVDVGKTIVGSEDIPLVSFTGSEKIGKEVGKVVSDRFGKSILELGGNNAVVVDKDADLALALQSVLFAAVGTAGQRCTSTRRLLLHKDISAEFLSKFLPVYDAAAPASHLQVGHPLDEGVLIGPLHNEAAVKRYEDTIEAVTSRGGEILTKRSGRIPSSSINNDELSGGHYVYPTVIKPSKNDPCWAEEVFAPILYVTEFSSLSEAIELNNSVPQGLSSALFTTDLKSMGRWLGPEGSDCGIVNVNVGTSGAEIGAGFGGNKSTGWGRESGGDAWKQYVRWSAATVNYSSKVALAQGVSFGVSA
ncbi:aldehyde dehydrogenase family 7 member A1 [Cryptococcus wingfieldii CBS 7118]|uniref:aldehyde dehydrogenase (NAD(+)) n=1 Tax=Cryptococcus wingfieldii CBS 7118 TaxID=1295528 RepID=A0A1E3JES3_9TREE|nr:aldehyde dehydrogenase family 7 member A1 [Cryptococcus wingfieldii CBS 7118]ODN99344.1 aldehyde dehydrogenase family 7 member A1 [Cryptococcus wingfieldii CBS 7118]